MRFPLASRRWKMSSSARRDINFAMGEESSRWSVELDVYSFPDVPPTVSRERKALLRFDPQGRRRVLREPHRGTGSQAHGDLCGLSIVCWLHSIPALKEKSHGNQTRWV